MPWDAVLVRFPNPWWHLQIIFLIFFVKTFNSWVVFTSESFNNFNPTYTITCNYLFIFFFSDWKIEYQIKSKHFSDVMLLPSDIFTWSVCRLVGEKKKKKTISLLLLHVRIEYPQEYHKMYNPTQRSFTTS